MNNCGRNPKVYPMSRTFLKEAPLFFGHDSFVKFLIMTGLFRCSLKIGQCSMVCLFSLLTAFQMPGNSRRVWYFERINAGGDKRIKLVW